MSHFDLLTFSFALFIVLFTLNVGRGDPLDVDRITAGGQWFPLRDLLYHFS